MEIFRGDFVRIRKKKNSPSYEGKIGQVRDVYNIRVWGKNGLVKVDQDIYTTLRKKPFKISEIEESSCDKAKLDKRKRK